MAPLELTPPELEQITPLLMGSGGAALGWKRVRETELRTSACGELLQQAFRLQSLQAELQEQKIETVFRLLREASLDGMLAKGWVAAKLYPVSTLRPYGDIDLCVRPRDQKQVAEILNSEEARGCWVDLHTKFSEIADRTLDELFARSRLRTVKNEQARVISDEDHLALLCIHFLKHGAWRPLWLCDVAAAVESAPAAFDWNACLGTDDTRAGWIKSAFALAHRVLGADLSRVPEKFRNYSLPDWLVETVYQAWSNPYAAFQPPMSHPVPISELWNKPASWANGLRERWPNPIIATISVHGKLNNAPRLPYQIANCLSRAARLVIRPVDEMQEH